MKRLALCLVALAVLATACGGAADGPTTIGPDSTAPGTTVEPTTTPTTSPTTAPDPTDTTMPSTSRPPDDTDPDLPAALAVSQLAEALGVKVSDININVIETVTWRDGSLGCPQPGMGYTQALVPGVRVILEHDGELYYYHGTKPDNLFYCENPQEPLAVDPGDA